MKAEQANRGTSIKQLKRRAREIRDAQGISLSQALEQASKEAGFEHYHAALQVLDTTPKVPKPPGEKDLLKAEATCQAIAAYVDDERNFDAMSKALSEIYYGKDRSLSEFALAFHAARDNEVSTVLGQWLGTALTNVDLDGPRFGTNIALILQAGDEEERPIACAIDGARALGQQIQLSLGVRGARVSFAPLALLVGRMEDGATLAEWLHVVHDQARLAPAIANGEIVLKRRGAPPAIGSGKGAHYVLFGRANAPMDSQDALDEALSEAACKGLRIAGETSDGAVDLVAVDLGAADLVMPWLYSAEMQRVASFVEDVTEEAGVRVRDLTLGLEVHDGEMERRVDIAVQVHDDDGRSTGKRLLDLGKFTFPTYLHLAMRKAFKEVGYSYVR